MAEPEQLGVIKTRSGVVVVIDTGYLRIWSHDRPPLLPQGILDGDATVIANSFVDLRLAGSDAEAVGRKLDMSWHPHYIYDQPANHPELDLRLTNVVNTHSLDAHLEVIPDRISHRQRVNFALDYGGGAGEVVQFHGNWAVAIGGVPKDQPLRVLGERSASPNKDRWKEVWVDCRPALEAQRSERVEAWEWTMPVYCWLTWMRSELGSTIRLWTDWQTMFSGGAMRKLSRRHWMQLLFQTANLDG